MDSIRNRIKGILDAVGEQMLAARETVEPVKICAGDYAFSEKFDPADHVWRDFGRDETWGGKDLHYWFLAAVTVTAAMDGRQIRVILNTGATDIWNTDNPQVMAYVDGRLAGTMDLNHQELILSDHGRVGGYVCGWFLCVFGYAVLHQFLSLGCSRLVRGGRKALLRYEDRMGGGGFAA